MEKKMNSESRFEAPLKMERKKYERGVYEVFPSYKLEEKKINEGYTLLADRIKSKVNDGLRVLVIDGYQGVEWHLLINSLKRALDDLGLSAEFTDVAECKLADDEIHSRIEPFLGGDDRTFGKHYPLGLEGMFDPVKLSELRIDISIERTDKSGKLWIIYGSGAGLTEQWDELWYIDMPKDFIQERFREGRIGNLSTSKKCGFEEFYKRSYFVEWPMLNRQKKAILPVLDIFIDFTDTESPKFIEGVEFRTALEKLSETPFRVKPWFYPGPWGGQYMKGHMGLDAEKPNFAWSFELIVPENGILISSGEMKLEFSFDCLMFAQNNNVLGNAANQFKYEWPIRFDYLDTIDGGNLSTQVHPRPDYIKKNFGETYTQDETYYIVNAKEDAKVYLGLKEDCDLDEFKQELIKSSTEETEVDIDKYVYSRPSKIHDLFLIPNGTVHCSGSNNMVLEISATPYIFTFKIYDYLRRDLEGRLRPINIERGFENIRPERKGRFIEDNLIARPKLIDSGNDWELFELYNKPYTFYKIFRVEFDTEFELDTKNNGYTINLVEGENVKVLSDNGYNQSLGFLETMVIPAAADKVKFVNKTGKKSKLVLVHVKEEVGKSMHVNFPND